MNNDLISRAALLEWVQNQKAEASGVYGNIIKAAIDAVLHYNVANAIRNAPTVDAEPVRHGRWEQYPGPGYTRCAHCKLEFDERKMPSVRDYCPNCGAKMDLE